MQAVHKFEFRALEGPVRLAMPFGAEVLAVAAQFGAPVVWAKVETDNYYVRHGFYLALTGQPIVTDPGRFVGSILLEMGAFVVHVFDCGQDPQAVTRDWVE